MANVWNPQIEIPNYAPEIGQPGQHWGWPGFSSLDDFLPEYRHPLNFAVNVDIGVPANIKTAKILT